MKRKGTLNSLLLFLVHFSSHIPFLNNGYGKEEDAWAQVLNARIIAQTGQYEVSRLPGHPVYEYLLAWLYPLSHSPMVFNGLSALASSFAVVIFYKIAQRMKLSNALWLSLSFGFVPVFFIAGNYTIDYNLALLFIMLSWWALLEKRIIWAALALGLAAGFRISSIAFILPIIILVRPLSMKQLVTYSLGAVGVAILCYVPPLMVYGTQFLDFHKPPFPSLANVLYKLSLGVWGIPLLLSFIVIKWRWMRKNKVREYWQRDQQFRRLSFSAVVAWVLCFLVFLRLPFKAEFFIPALPFLMLMLGYICTKKQVQVVFLASLLGTFSMGFDYFDSYRGAAPSALAWQFEAGGKQIFFDPIQGPAQLDAGKRTAKTKLVRATADWMEKQADSTLLIAGWYWPELEVSFPSPQGTVVTDYYATEKEILDNQTRGFQLFYLPEINIANAKIYSHYLADSLGQPLHPL